MRNVNGKNAGPAQGLRELARRESLVLHVVELDVTEDGSVERAISTVIDETGRIDVLVNNAGYGLMGVTEGVTLEQGGGSWTQISLARYA
jgi:NAD(P)-dependent dehydrogenase (short-subunit alcohol dehydrogenase family)